MPDSPGVEDQLLTLYREEYARLSKRCESLMDSSFDDFKMLAASGALVAWPPLAQFAQLEQEGSGHGGLILFMGYIGILFIVAILGVRDALKWSIIEYYLQHIQVYENEIRARADGNNETFQFARNWEKYRRNRYLPVFRRFSILFTLLLFILPIGALAVLAGYYFAGLYFLAFVIALGIYHSTGRALGWL